MSRLQRLRSWWAHAFAVEDAEAPLTDEERELIERLAAVLRRRRLTAPATMVLESGRPLNYVGSQVLAFLAPFATFVFRPAEYERFTRLLERRSSIDHLLAAINAERQDSEDE